MLRTHLSIVILIVAGSPVAAQDSTGTASDPVARLVTRLDLEHYKATIKGLTHFGDRRQGTARNRAAVDWIEAQLKGYGCGNTERIRYEYSGRQIRQPGDTTAPQPRPAARPNPNPRKGTRGPTGVNLNPDLQ